METNESHVTCLSVHLTTFAGLFLLTEVIKNIFFHVFLAPVKRHDRLFINTILASFSDILKIDPASSLSHLCICFSLASVWILESCQSDNAHWICNFYYGFDDGNHLFCNIIVSDFYQIRGVSWGGLWRPRPPGHKRGAKKEKGEGKKKRWKKRERKEKRKKKINQHDE